MEEFKDDIHMFHSFINDFWRFAKTHFTGDVEDEAFWDEVIRLGNEIPKKYGNHPACVRTMVGFLDYLEYEGCGRDRKKIKEIIGRRDS